MCSVLAQVHGLKNKVYSRVARLFRLMALKNQVIQVMTLFSDADSNG